MSLKQNYCNPSSPQGLGSMFCPSSNINAFHTFTPLRLHEIAGGAWMKSFPLSYSNKFSNA
jgi:hypothetical protein